MEDVIARMQDEKNGIPIRTVKSFLSKIPSVFSGKWPSNTAMVPSTCVTSLVFKSHHGGKSLKMSGRHGMYQEF